MNKEEIFAMSNKLKQIAVSKGHLSSFKERNIYKHISGHEPKSKIIIGLRRIGKTALLNQVVINKFYDVADDKVSDINNDHHLIQTMHDGLSASTVDETTVWKKMDDLLFLKMDSIEFMSKTAEQLSDISILVKNIIGEYKIKTLLIDEIQVIPKWNFWLKDLKDFYPELWILCTGSNSNELEKSSEQGVGRFQTAYHGVLTFQEFINKKTNETVGSFPTDDLQLLTEYIDYNHFPAYDINTYQEEVSPSVVEKALQHSSQDKTLLFKLISWIAKNPGSLINSTNISRDTSITRKNVTNYLETIASGQLIWQLTNATSLTSAKKVYFLIPGLFALYNSGESFGKMDSALQGAHFENFVFIQLLNLTTNLFERMKWTYLNDRSKQGINEIDFVHGNVGFEVKRTIDERDAINYARLARKHNIGTLYFIYMNGPKKKENMIFDLDGKEVIVKFLKWDEFVSNESVEMIRKELNVY